MKLCLQTLYIALVKNPERIWVRIASFKSYARFTGFSTYDSEFPETSNKRILA
jgi:hypothetical protein